MLIELRSLTVDINLLLFIGIALVDLSMVLFAWWLGKPYLTATIILNVILTSGFVGKLIPIFGFVITAGEIFYASIFIATDILTEHYGKKEGYRSIFSSFVALAGFAVLSNFALGFTSIQESSVIAQAMQELFSLLPRITIASFVSYLITQSFDIWLYHKIKAKTGESKLWLRNNLSTISAQLLDSLIFFPLAFFGTVPTEVLISLMLTGWLFKTPIALIDTIFIYLSYSIKGLPVPDISKWRTSKSESVAAGIE